MTKKVVFADLHYRKGDDHLFDMIKEVLKRDNFKDVIFLGDTFDFFFEFKNKFYKRENLNLLNFLKEISKEYDVYLVRGNHDMYMGKMLKSYTGCKEVVDQICIENGDQKIFLTHGHIFINDGFVKKILYSILKNNFDRFLFSLLPESLGYILGIFVSDLCNMRVMEEEKNVKSIEKKVRENFGKDFKKIIVAHYHIDFVSEDHKIYSLADFKKKGSYLKIDEKGVLCEHF
ncbi:MAG: metallophosphoesterase [candidate division WOR-3 bacterium]|jgi:UDP-2,3-diacylglucosamine pyrophosphatase LpxH